jgi:hypothetical protein
MTMESLDPPPYTVHENVEEDVDMEHTGLGTKEQEQKQGVTQVQQRIYSSERMLEAMELAQQEMSGHVVQVNQSSEIEQETEAPSNQLPSTCLF